MLAFKNLYHNLFSDLDLEHSNRFYRNFSITTVSHWLLGHKIFNETNWKPKLSEIKTELDLRHPLDLLTKNLLKSTDSIENSDDFILCGDIKSEPLMFRENLHLVVQSLPQMKLHDDVSELIDKEIANLIDEEISLVENCNFYTYQDIPKKLVHNIIRNWDMFQPYC